MKSNILNRLAQPKYLLPFMIFTCLVMAGMRANSMLDTISSGKLFQPISSAQAAAEAENKIEEPPHAVLTETKTETKTKSSAPQEEVSGTEMELIRQLSDKRDQLEKNSRALETREALIKVAEQRVDQKIKEMETLRTQLQAMVNQAGASQQAQLDNLVKIYETMKPKEAARIFETLELSVLLGVVQKMKPQRTAAVMAEMAPERAKEITVALTKQDQLPQIK